MISAFGYEGASSRSRATTFAGGSRTTIVVSVIMLLAMVDVMVTGIVPASLWAAVLFITGIVEAARYRWGRSLSHDRIGAYHAISHTGMAAVIVAHSIAAATGSAGHSSANMSSSTGHHHSAAACAVGPEVFVLALAVAVAVAGIIVTALEIRRTSPVGRLP